LRWGVLSTSKFFSTMVLPAFTGCEVARLEAIASRNPEKARLLGIERVFNSYEALLADPSIDAVYIPLPNHLHVEWAMKAARAGKHVLCEKPLANDLAEAREMLAAVQKAGVKSMVAFNYRRVPAIAFAKQLIEAGKIGEIYHWRAVYLQDWIMDPEFPLVWRLQKDKAGSGPHGDLNAHITDLARYLVGDIAEVVGVSETFIKERPLVAAVDDALGAKASKEMGPVTVEDAMLFLARFENGALGSFEGTRFAGGRRNHNRFEINGSKGSIAFNLEKMNELQYYSCEDDEGMQGFREIIVNEGAHPYMAAWWPPGHIIGWEHTFVHEVYDLMNAIATDTDVHPDFAEGVKCQEVLEAVSMSLEERTWVKVSEV